MFPWSREYHPVRYWERRGRTYPAYEEKLARIGSTDVHLSVLKSALSSLKPRSVLEIGCGSGRIARWIASEVPTYVGLDLAKSMLAHAHRTVPRSRGWVRGSSASLPFGSKSFDVVVASEVLLHVRPEHIAQTLSEMKRVSHGAVIIDSLLKEFEDPHTFRRVSESLARHNFLHDYPRLFREAGLQVRDRTELGPLRQTCFVVAG